MSFIMSDDGKVIVTTESDLVFLRDFRHASQIVRQVLQEKIGFLGMVAGIPAVQVISQLAGWQIPFLDMGMEIATIFVSASVIALTYSKLNPAFKVTDLAQGAETRVFAAGVSYGFRAVLLGFLFVVPGVWFATNNCLATVFACLEDCKAGESMKRSTELVKGNFTRVFIYALFKPFLIWLAIWTIFGLLLFMFTKMGNGADKLTQVAEGVLWFVSAIFQLMLSSLLVRLYVFLKNSNQSLASPAVSDSSLSPGNIGGEDSSLTPRW